MSTPQRTPPSPAGKATSSLIDQAPDFLRSGYLFASRVRARAGVDPASDTPVPFPLLGKRTVLLRGAEGVRYFYDRSKVKRDGAMPVFIRGPLFGAGAVHGLDGEAHATRKKAMAAVAYDDAHVDRFATLVVEELGRMLDGWRRTGRGSVYDDTATAYGRAAFRWAGIELPEREADARARQMSRLLDTFGRPATTLVSWAERRRLDTWSTGLVEEVRAGRRTAVEGTALAAMAELRDENGGLVDAHTAAVELQNLTRPTVAVARFAAFAAVALTEHPEWAGRVREAAGETGALDSAAINPVSIAFAQEVRRYYPFVPMLPALATTDGEVGGCPVHRGDRLLIDILGTNTDPQAWERPATFDPERFLGVDDAEQIECFIPQGGADVVSGHRCPGEKIAVTALAATVSALARREVVISGDVDDTTFSWTHMLTRPRTGVRVSVRSA